MAREESVLKAALKDFWNDLRGKAPYYRYLEREDRRRRIAGRALFLANFIAAIVYLAWLLSVINLSVWYFTLLFFMAEVSALITITVFSIIMWHPRFHDPAGVPTEENPTVDVFIATAGEPLEILEPTVKAAANIDYPKKTLYILDDASSSAVEELAYKYGCRYLARKEHEDAKAGNLNYGIAHSNGELILALDADQVSDPDIIKRLVGYFKFSHMAFVQSAQRFILPKGDPFGNSDELFYKTMQTGKDTDNSAFSCGSGVMYRRKALIDIGGFSTWNLVEDVQTSMRLHAIGWRSAYYNHPLSTGTAPTDVLGVYKQRGQWATDSIRLLFWDSPLRQEGLNLKQKVQYFQAGFVYLVSAFVMPIYYITPGWSMLTGNFIINAPAIDYVIFRGVYLIFTILAMVIMQRPADTRKPYKIWAGLFPVFIRATLIALRSRDKKPAYFVTGKTLEEISFFNKFKAVLPQLLIMGLIIFSIAYGFALTTLPLSLLLINAAWGLWVVWTLSGIVYATFVTKEMPRRQRRSDSDADWPLSA